MTAAAHPHRGRANALLLICAVIWGFAFVAQVYGAHVGAFTFTSSRFLLGAVSLLPIIAWVDRRASLDAAERRRRWVEAIRPGLLIGAFLFGGSTLQQLSLEWTTAGNVSFVTGLYVVFVPVVGIALGHRTSANTWGGAALALIGLYLLTMSGGLLNMNQGDALCLVSTLFWTGHILCIGHFSRKRDVLRLSVAQFVANSIYSGIAAFVLEPHPFVGLPGIVLPLLYAGVMSVGVAYTLQVVAQRDALESHAALIMSLETLFGAVGGALFLRERMSTLGYTGAALMLAGIVWSQLPHRRRPGERIREPSFIPVPEAPSNALED